MVTAVLAYVYNVFIQSSTILLVAHNVQLDVATSHSIERLISAGCSSPLEAHRSRDISGAINKEIPGHESMAQLPVKSS